MRIQQVVTAEIQAPIRKTVNSLWSTHTFPAWQENVPATCSTAVEEIRTCDCGVSETRSIPATGVHTTTKELVCSVCQAAVAYHRDGNRIYFGEYPQTLKAENVVVSNSVDQRGYYLGSDNAYYAKVVAAPHDEDYVFSTGATVTAGEECYFKAEPIAWRVITESNGTAIIVCESVIANGAFGVDTNDYAASAMRTWLNGAFYQSAFQNAEKALILTTQVDNSIESTGHDKVEYACENTQDNIFLLSYAEATNPQYGFSSNDDRSLRASDYSLATGVFVNSEGNGYWWLRSPASRYEYYARLISGGGGSSYANNVDCIYYGIVPVLQIDLY